MEERSFSLKIEVDPTSLCLNGDRIRLRSINETYASEMREEFTEEITRYMFPKPAESIEEVLAFISTSRKGMEDCRELVFAVLEKENEEFLGCCGLHGKEDPRKPELARTIHKPSATTADLTASQSHPLPSDRRGFQHAVVRRPAERF